MYAFMYKSTWLHKRTSRPNGYHSIMFKVFQVHILACRKGTVAKVFLDPSTQHPDSTLKLQMTSYFHMLRN
jgi:hypothetical protein